ncbi:MAG: RDD family protein [Alphaproteobacteria bacterium]
MSNNMSDYSPPPPPGFESTPATSTGETAGFWIRALAYLIDAIIVTVVNMLIMLPITFLMGGAMAIDPNTGAVTTSAAGILVNLLGLAIGIVYFIVLPAGSRQATFGKKIMGLRFVKQDGGPVTMGTLALRYIGYIVSSLLLFIGFIMIAFTDRNRGLHDMIAGTLVVKTR